MRLHIVLLLSCILGVTATAQDEKELLREKLRDEVAKRWIYDDIDSGFAEAKRTGKPMLVVIRCVP